MAIIQGNSSVESAVGGYEIPNSLRFNSADSAYLTRTPASAGNRRTWTISFWYKRSTLSTTQWLFSAGTAGSSDTNINIGSNDTIAFFYNRSSGALVESTQVFRDTSAWHHMLVAVDTTQATSSNRVKAYINGVQVTAFSTASYPAQNEDTSVNNTVAQYIGRRSDGIYLDGYLTEFYLIDGQALTPSDFGEFNTDTGVWQPKAYEGSYGTNGFYLPMTQDQIVEGFNTVLWRGTSSYPHKITGVGFAPDLVWVKSRNKDYSHVLYDSVRGTGSTKSLIVDSTGAEGASSTLTNLSSFDADGFTIGSTSGTNILNTSSYNYVGWCWDAGNSTVTNNDGDIESQVRANPTYGFSVVTWTNASNGDATVGHGLGVAPKLIITKKRSTTNDWYTFTTAIDGSYDYLKLNATDAKADSAKAAPTSTVFTTDMGDTSTAVAYCFSEVSGYSKFSSYTGDGGSSNAVTVGFKPAFVMIKRSVGGIGNWRMFDSTRSTTNSSYYLNANTTSAEGTDDFIDFTDTGFVLNDGTDVSTNASGSTYIYAAFADKREAAFWRDFSGNGNNWQPNNLDFNDSVTDTPTQYGEDTGVGAEVRGNYATLNPLDKVGSVLANGNLDQSYTGTAPAFARSTIGVSSGKWYCEITAGTGNPAVGVWHEGTIPTWLGSSANGYAYYSGDGKVYTSNVGTSYGSTYTNGDVIGIALDADANTVTFYKNNTSQGAYSIPSGKTWYFACGNDAASTKHYANFGQRPFAYTVSSGFKALCTTNLPEPTVADGGEYFNAVTYTGDGTSPRAVSNVGFTPSFVWIKSRSSGTDDHILTDAVRGANKTLKSNTTDAEATTAQGLLSFDSDGFSVGSAGAVNTSSASYVAWNWKAGGSGVSNTDGSITSTVSANTTSGFSIVTYTGNNTSGATVGHGLGIQPAMVICKNRTTGIGSGAWPVWHKSLSGGNYYLFLNTTAAQSNGNNNFTSAPTSTVLNLGTSDTNNTADMVAYCFAPVEGFSAMGSFVGNGSTDGVFVHLGFRPKFVLVKRTDSTSDWDIFDSSRDNYNVMTKILSPNGGEGNVEYSNASNYAIDFISNGFKVRSSTGFINASGGTYIYAAFAENSFKYALAR